jgi:hypothetical protein
VLIPDLPVIRTSIATVKVNIGIPDTTYIDKCTGLIQNNKFTSQCGQFTDAAAFYIVACIEDAMDVLMTGRSGMIIHLQPVSDIVIRWLVTKSVEDEP